MDDEKELVLVMSKYLSLGNNCKQKSTLLQSDESMSCEETQESHSHRLSLHSASWRRQKAGLWTILFRGRYEDNGPDSVAVVGWSDT